MSGNLGALTLLAILVAIITMTAWFTGSKSQTTTSTPTSPAPEKAKVKEKKKGRKHPLEAKAARKWTIWSAVGGAIVTAVAYGYYCSGGDVPWTLLLGFAWFLYLIGGWGNAEKGGMGRYYIVFAITAMVVYGLGYVVQASGQGSEQDHGATIQWMVDLWRSLK